jgi:hypothetical protein
MTWRRKTEVARRPLLAGLLGVLGVAAVGGAVYESGALFRKRYRPTPFDDLLSSLPDRDAAIRVGAAILAEEPGFDARKTAQQLRQEIGEKPLADVAAMDIDESRMVEIKGWVLPETLAKLCALAAKAA